MDKKLLTTVTFQENCEYQSSTVTKEVIVPQQNVQVMLEVVNVTANDPANQIARQIYKSNYYTDILRCVASVALPNDNGPNAAVRVGRIEFYYQPEGSNVRKLLNKSNNDSPNCLLNNQGQAAIDIQPKESGTIIAVYIDENNNYIAENEASSEILLQRMPVDIQFTKSPAFIANVEDEIELEVEVKDVNNNPINYGLVTFMHYNIKEEDINNPEKRIEKVIGNPVLVKNGKATIKYIPVQTDNNDIHTSTGTIDLEPERLDIYGEERHLERIRAVYNYDNDFYGHQWKYYTQDSVWTNVAIAKRSSLTIGIENGNNTENLSYQCTESQSNSITIKAALHDKNNDNIHLTEDDIINITYHIEGTHSHPTAQPNSLQYNENQDFRYIEYNTELHFNNNNENNTFYNITLPKLRPGTYIIYASVDEYNIKKQKDSYDNDDDMYYSLIDRSNELQLTVTYDKTMIYSINNAEETYQVNTKFILEKQLHIPQLTDNIINALNRQKCYLYISKMDKTYECRIIQKNAGLYIQSNDIQINTAGRYNVFLQIPSGVYSSNLDATEYHSENIDFYMPYIETYFTLNIIENINMELKAVFEKTNQAPCNTDYSIIASDITTEIYVSLYYKKSNSNEAPTLINNQILLTKDNNTNYGKVSNALDAGDYQLIANASNGQQFTHNFHINSNTLTQQLIDNKIEMGINKTIGIYLKNDTNIRNIDINKISVYTQEATSTYNKNIANKVYIQSHTFIDNNTLFLKVNSHTYTEGEYWVSISYDGDNNFIQTDCMPEKFTTFLYTPQVQLTRSNDMFNIEIFYYDNNGNKRVPNQYLILPIGFTYHNGNSPIGTTGVLITNNKGQGSLYVNGENIKDPGWWQQWGKVIVIFRKNDTDITNILNTNWDYDDFYENFDAVFDIYNITSTTQLKNNLQNQFNSNNKEYIFDTYKNTSITVRKI